MSGFRLRVLQPGWGETAAFHVVRRYEPEITDREPTPWVASALGLDRYLMIRRDWKLPNSGLFGPVYRGFGGERNLQATFGP